MIVLPTIDAHEIVENLWQGSVPPRGSDLYCSGFRALVLCAWEYQFESDLFPGIQVIHAPNDDLPEIPITREQLQIALTAARKVASLVRQDTKVLVTCAAGLNRSAFVVALALHILYGWSGSHCIGRIRQRRCLLNGMEPLSNTSFLKALRNLPNKPNPVSVFPLDSL